MIVDPFDRTQGITKEGKPAAKVWLLPAGASPTDMSESLFLGLAVTWDEPDEEPGA